MQARTTLNKGSVSRRSGAVVALAAAVVLGVSGAFLVKALTTPTAVAPVVAVSSYGATESGSAWNFSPRHAGTQSVADPADSSPDTVKAPGLRHGAQI